MHVDEQHEFNGIHVLGEFYGVKTELLDDMDVLESLLVAGIAESGATLCSIQKKQFDPSGVTILALLSESHTSIHTYPQEGSLFFDAFTCGTTCQPEKIAEILAKGLKPQKTQLKTIARGNLDRPEIKLSVRSDDSKVATGHGKAATGDGTRVVY